MSLGALGRAQRSPPVTATGAQNDAIVLPSNPFRKVAGTHRGHDSVEEAGGREGHARHCSLTEEHGWLSRRTNRNAGSLARHRVLGGP
jgi:hypothetical protein